MGRTTVPRNERESRIERIRETINKQGFDGLCLFTPTNIEWATGFIFVQTERPVCVLVTPDDVAITVPRLELERASSDDVPILESVEHYYEYPGGDGTYYVHPQQTPEEAIRTMLAERGVKYVAADISGAPHYWGYTGPTLAECAGVDVEVVDWIEEFRKRKSDVEIELIKESAMWANLTHRKLLEYVEPGELELVISKRASIKASRSMYDALGDRYTPRSMGGFPTWCSFLSGPNTALPHGLSGTRRVQRGDILVTGAISNVGGYRSELERTMFVGTPTDEHRHYFEIVTEAQRIAIEESGPGIPCAYVDQCVHDYFHEQGVLEYAQHHTGHNLGMEGHERDFIDRGSDEVMQPGHVYSIEPGIYRPGVAGYRHSDTIVITDSGVEQVTYFPSDLESVTITLE